MLRMCVCVCVWERERERERERILYVYIISVCAWERETVLCIHQWERENVLCIHQWELRKRKRLCHVYTIRCHRSRTHCTPHNEMKWLMPAETPPHEREFTLSHTTESTEGTAPVTSQTQSVKWRARRRQRERDSVTYTRWKKRPEWNVKTKKRKKRRGKKRA
jgi:hypothetical protein